MFRLVLPSDEALLLILDPAGPLDVIGLVHAFDPPLIGRCQEGHLVHISPHSPLCALGIVAQLREEQEGATGGSQGFPGCRSKNRMVCQDCSTGWGCFSHATFIVLVLLGLNN